MPCVLFIPIFSPSYSISVCHSFLHPYLDQYLLSYFTLRVYIPAFIRLLRHSFIPSFYCNTNNLPTTRNMYLDFLVTFFYVFNIMI